MIKRVAAILLVIPTGALLASCASKGSGQGTPVLAADVTKLGHQMRLSTASVHSAKFELSIDAAGHTITGEGAETMRNGKVRDLDVKEDLSALDLGTIRVRMVHGRTYAQLPAQINSSSKPWVLVSEDSADPRIAQLASTMNNTMRNASIGAYGYFAQAAKNMNKVGTESVNGMDTTHYRTDLDLSKLPADYPNLATMKEAGISDIPVDMWVDKQHRPVKVDLSVSVDGQSVHVEFSVTSYNTPVQISAPPASQVSTD